MTFTVEILNEHALKVLRELEEMRVIRLHQEQDDKQPASSMHEASKLSSNEPFLSTAEIRQLYPNEWVLIADPQVEGLEIQGGKVLAHDPEKRNMAVQGKDLIRLYARVTHFYTGEVPKTAKIGLIRRIES